MELMVNGHNVFLIIIITFLCSVILVPVMMRVAVHVNAMDYPDGVRKMQKKPMPRLGGVAIFLSFMVGYMLFARESTMMLSILMASFLLVLVGFVDSINPVKARYQLLTHIIAAITVSVYGGLVLNDVSFLGLNFSFPYTLNYLVTIIFIIAFINMINLIDGLDGLAGGICSIYFATIAIIGLIFTQMEGLDVILALIMFGATTGFLVYNFPPAKTYMGNCGSDFLGFIVGVIALLGFKATTLTSIVIPVLIMAIPIFDTLFAILRRAISHKGIFTPDREHLHHQLLKLKFSPRTSILIIYSITIMFSAVSIFFVLGDQKIAMAIYIILMLILVFIVMKTDILFKHKKTKEKELKAIKNQVYEAQKIMHQRKKNLKKKKNK